jgi:hypothetical protein
MGSWVPRRGTPPIFISRVGRQKRLNQGNVARRLVPTNATLRLALRSVAACRVNQNVHTHRLNRAANSFSNRLTEAGLPGQFFLCSQQGYPQHTHRLVNRTARQQPNVEGTSTAQPVRQTAICLRDDQRAISLGASKFPLGATRFRLAALLVTRCRFCRVKQGASRPRSPRQPNGPARGPLTHTRVAGSSELAIQTIQHSIEPGQA